MAFFSPQTASGDVIDVNIDVNLDNFTLQDLLKLRADIDRRLPAKHLRDVNLERELILQHQATLELQNQVMQDSDVPANQRAQCANAVASILQQLIKLQETVHTTERLKRIEGKLIEALNGLPKEQQESFLAVYEEVLGSDFRPD